MHTKSQEKRPLRHAGIEGGIILKWVLNKCVMRTWTSLCWLSNSPCEHDKEYYGIS
jgi:hypothetical protein